ncbi:competence protein CoiA family protein [Deinococcus yunweiensis]|uniref:competence protein CoiA family protein n=1 Tax=Deinococcus yunweiensis TaxID=367282 RepID=UPI00398F58A5
MTLAVPYALDAQQRLIRPADAVLRGQYWCLQCGHTVYFKPGRVKTAHLVHASGASCSGESVLHLAAKRALVEGLPGLTELGILMPCRRADCPDVEVMVWPLPAFDDVQAEVTLGEYRLDVALLWDGQVVLAIEVYQTHRIGEPKGQGLTVPWVEVPAEAVLENLQLLQPVVDTAVTAAQLQAARPASPSMAIYHLTVFDALTRWQDLRFHARRPQQTLLPTHLCPACTEDWRRELNRRSTRDQVAALEQERAQRRAEAAEVARLHAAAEAQERQRAAQAEQNRLQRLQAERLQEDAVRDAERHRRQRGKNGSRLRQPLSRAAEQFLDDHAHEIRDALEYLRPELLDFMVLDDRLLILKTCQKCGAKIVHIDTGEYFGVLWPYGGLLKYWKKPGASRGWVFNVCQHCQAWQKREPGGISHYHALRLDGAVFLELLTAFGQLPRKRTTNSRGHPPARHRR